MWISRCHCLHPLMSGHVCHYHWQMSLHWVAGDSRPTYLQLVGNVTRWCVVNVFPSREDDRANEPSLDCSREGSERTPKYFGCLRCRVSWSSTNQHCPTLHLFLLENTVTARDAHAPLIDEMIGALKQWKRRSLPVGRRRSR